MFSEQIFSMKQELKITVLTTKRMFIVLQFLIPKKSDSCQ